MTKLTSEQVRALPQRCETSFISIGNVNWAAVGQNNTNIQAMGVGVLAAQLSAQQNNAVVYQHN